jgi:hypothetical protein
MERETGIEPATSSLGKPRSTSPESRNPGIRKFFQIQSVANNGNHFKPLRPSHPSHELHGTPLLSRFSYSYRQYGQYEISCAPSSEKLSWWYVDDEEKNWSGRRGSNPQPTAWEAATLPLSYSRSASRVYRKTSIANATGRTTLRCWWSGCGHRPV